MRPDDGVIHVIGRGCEALWNLNCPRGPLELRENYGFSRQEIASMKQSLADRLSELCRAWEEIHGF